MKEEPIVIPCDFELSVEEIEQFRNEWMRMTGEITVVQNKQIEEILCAALTEEK